VRNHTQFCADLGEQVNWGSGAPGSVIRTTSFTYLTGSAYTAQNILNRVSEKTIADQTGTIQYREDTNYDESGYVNSPCITGAAQHDDTNFGCSFTARGNPTSEIVYTNASAKTGGITKHSTYNSLGSLVKADLDCCQQRQWSFSSATNYAYPDSVTCGLTGGPQTTTSSTYNAYTGQEMSSTDPNSHSTSYTYDIMKRKLTETRPDNSQLAYVYNDTLNTVTVKNPVDGTNFIEETTSYDGLGRSVLKTTSNVSGTTYSIVSIQFDPLSRTYKVSDPYTSSAQYWTTTQYDALGRITKTIAQDNGQTTYAYATNSVTLTDPTGKQRKSVTDGLRHVVSVYEPDPTNNNSLTLQTSYTFTVLDKITGLTQGSQTRTYTYDGAGRMTSERTPEAATVNFQYSNFDKVTQRT
jgi:YD repeat-containing protein